MKVDPVFIAGVRSDEHDKNPYIWSSTNWMLWESGCLWAVGGRSEPVIARKSRGYTVRVETADNAFVVAFVGDDLRPEVRRL
jgi:hypothetical protein